MKKGRGPVKRGGECHELCDDRSCYRADDLPSDASGEDAFQSQDVMEVAFMSENALQAGALVFVGLLLIGAVVVVIIRRRRTSTHQRLQMDDFSESSMSMTTKEGAVVMEDANSL
jgi:hypothetical protein